MYILLSLLDAHLALHEHAASTLEKALKRQQFVMGQQHLFDEQAFLPAYHALRDVEAQGLRLLRETALLAQSLRREEAARQTEQQLGETFQTQAAGNGKKAAIISKDALEKQEKTVAKDHHRVYQQAEQLVDILLAQHEAIVRADRLFRTLDPRFVLLESRADAAILKVYALAEDSAQKLRELVRAEIEQGRPRKLAAALAETRGKMRQGLTRLSEARRQFAAFIQQRLPMIGAL